MKKYFPKKSQNKISMKNRKNLIFENPIFLVKNAILKNNNNFFDVEKKYIFFRIWFFRTA